MTDLPKTVVERYVTEVLNGKDRSRIEALVKDGNLRQRIAVFLAAFPDLTITTRHLIAEGNVVALHLVGSATHQGPFQGMPPTGRSWSASCSALYEVADGSIVDAWVNWDLLSIMEQIGAIHRSEGASA